MDTEYYILLENEDKASNFINDILGIGIKEKEVHIISNEDLQINGCHKATVLEKTHILKTIIIGSFVGALAGLGTGLMIVTFPVGELTYTSKEVFTFTSFIGWFIGLVVSLLAGSSFPKKYYEQYKMRILAGEIIVIIDVPSDMIDSLAISDILYQKYADCPTGIVEAL